MKRKEQWRVFSTTLTRDSTVQDHLGDAIYAIAYLTIPERKELLKISRTARHPYYNLHAQSLSIANRFYKHQRSDLQCFEHCGLQVREVVDILGTFIHKDPICAAILNNACRSAPFLGLTAKEADANRTGSWEKEIFACSGIANGPALDYTCWFSEDSKDRNKPLGMHLPSAPIHNTRIHGKFLEWRKSMEGVRLFPQIQTGKSMSRVTAKRYWENKDPSRLGAQFDSNVSSAMVERVYADDGVEIQGPCELRQIWTYNDLTPRTYFSQGGTAFHDSKYIRLPLNRLSDHFEEVNFITRFSIQDILIHDNDTVFIYDYESFTSNLEEFKYFMAELAAFCDGVMIQVVDSREGVLNYDLGNLLREYNETCNNRGQYMVLRYLPEDFTLYEHGRAGFLGVYGNIVGSTVLHGLHATQVDGDFSDGKCVGDDAFIRRLYHEGMVDQSEIYSRLRALGIVHAEKTTSWGARGEELESDTMSTWPYCKRPIYRSANRMIHEANISLPILGRLCGFQDEVRCDEGEDHYELVKIAAIQTLTAFRQVKSLLETNPVKTSSLDILINYLDYVYARLGLPREGCLPFESFRSSEGIIITGVLVPPIDHSIFCEDTWNLLKRRYDNADIFLLVPQTTMDEEICDEELIQTGSASGIASQVTSYLVKMGWARSTQRKMLASFTYDEYARYYKRIFDGDAVFVYDFVMCDNYPTWITELCNRSR